MINKLKNIYQDIIEFLKGVKAEAKRITWPDKAELKKGTMAVIVILIIVTIFLWICETFLLSFLGKLIL